MYNFNSRLAYLIDLLGFKNPNEFAKSLGYKSPEKINRLLRGSNNKPSFEVIDDILSTYKQVNARWLVSGEGEVMGGKKHTLVSDSDIKYRSNIKTNKFAESIPLYNLEATAGIVSLFEDHKHNNPIDYIQVPNLPKCDGAIYITGDSMYPLLKSGDIVIYKEIKDVANGIYYGEMYIISINLDGDEFVSVKFLQKSDKGEDYVKLVSENKHHQPKDIAIKSIRALALVKASIRINSMS